jgi:hypothetical protein
MFLLDNILLSPLHGVLWVARELDKVAQEELANESGTIRADLSGLYLLLEKGQITEEEFDAREKVLLDRLDAISERLVAEEGEAQGEGDREGYKKVESEKALEGVGG